MVVADLDTSCIASDEIPLLHTSTAEFKKCIGIWFSLVEISRRVANTPGPGTCVLCLLWRGAAEISLIDCRQRE